MTIYCVICVCVCINVYTHMYIYIHAYTYKHIYIHIKIRQRNISIDFNTMHEVCLGRQFEDWLCNKSFKCNTQEQKG